jgi:hypothetical protein
VPESERRETRVTKVCRPINAPAPVAPPGTPRHDLAASLAAIGAATGEGEPGDDLLRYLCRNALVSAAIANHGVRDLAPLQRAVSACLASGAYRALFGLSDEDVAALIGSD